jgi:hypothetical protein
MEKWGKVPGSVIEVHSGRNLAYTFDDFEGRYLFMKRSH